MRIAFIFNVFLMTSFFGVSQTFQSMTEAWNIVHSYPVAQYGGGVTIYDWNKDGLDDIVFCRRFSTPLFYQNNGNGFTLIQSPLPAFAECKQISFVDFDNDGDPDIFVTVYSAHPRLFRNNGDFTFTDITGTAGISLTSVLSFGHTWGDFDLDGYVDVYVCNYNGPGTINPGLVNQFYRNNGDGTFTEMAVQLGIDNGSKYSMAAVWMDYNNDHIPDLWVTNDRLGASNFMYKNQGNGVFEDVTVSAGLEAYIFSMCATIGDVQNNGLLDMYVTNNPDGNLLHINNGNGTFTQSAQAFGVALNTFNWGANLIDFDNDGWQDLFVNSSPHIQTTGMNQLFKNINGLGFTEITLSAGFSQESFYNHSSAVGDFNGDGLYDIAITRQTPGQSQVFLNTTENPGNFIRVTLEGVNANRDGIGSRIIAYANGGLVQRYTAAGEGYLSQNSQHIILGLGEATIVDSLKVIWPGGYTDVHYHLPVNQSYYIIEGFYPECQVFSSNGEFQACPDEFITLECDVIANQYQWNGTPGEQSISVNESGVFEVIIQHWTGLYATCEAEVIMLEGPSIESVIVSNVSCQGLSDGAIQVFASDSSVVVVWSDGLISNGLMELSAGFYSFVALDSLGCMAPWIEVEVHEPDSLMASWTIDPVFDMGNCPYTWTATVASPVGGTPPYSAFWEIELLNGQGEVVDVLTSELWELDCIEGPAVLNLAVSDSVGCTVQFSQSVDFLIGTVEVSERNVRIYPNPASGSFTIETNRHIGEVRLYDLTGALVEVIECPIYLTLTMVDIAKLTPGVFLVHVLFKDGSTFSHRLVTFDE